MSDYNDDFDLMAWIRVPADFDVIRLTKTILTSLLGRQNVDIFNLNELREDLEKQLFEKNFLLDLDDVCNRNSDDWVDLSRLLQVGAPGSKIIVTTRDQEDADSTDDDERPAGTVPASQLRTLSDNDRPAVFTQHSLGTRDFRSHESLQEIGKKVYKLLNKSKKRTIAVLLLVRNLFTYLVSEAASFVLYLLGCLVWKVISSLRDTFSYLLLGPTSFVRQKLLESISSARELFSNLPLGAISCIQDLVKKSEPSFLLAFGISVCAWIIARTTAPTRQEFERQLIGAVVTVFSVIQWTITSVFVILADLGVKSNYSASVLLLLFSIATLFLFRKEEDATDSSPVIYNTSLRKSRISHIPAVDYVPRTSNHFLLLVSSPTSHMAPAARQVHQQYQWQNIRKVYRQLGKYKKRSLAVFYLVLEAASFFLDIFGKSKRGFLLAAFLLSAIGFAMNMYICFVGRRIRGATEVHSQKQLVEQLVRTVEVAFSLVHLIVTAADIILVLLHVENKFSAPVLALVFSVIVAVFTFKYDGEASDPSGHTDDDLYGALPVTNIPLIQALSTMAPAADHRLNLFYQLQNILDHIIAAWRAIDLSTFTRNADAEANGNSSTLAIVISNA